MPRKGRSDVANSSKGTPQTNTSRKQGEDDWGGFIAVSLSDEDKAAFAVWAEAERDAIWTMFDDLLGSGFKWGVSFDAENDCYIASLTGCGVVGTPLRWCLTARGGAWDAAVQLVLFKHYVLAQGDWGNYRPRHRNFGSEI